MSLQGFFKVTGLGRLFSRWRRDERGIAAVEFGMIAPTLVLMLMGAVEITRAVALDRRVSVATSMVADIVARGNGSDKPFTSADVNAIYDVVERVMDPYDAAPLKLSLIPVMANPDNKEDTAVYTGPANRPGYHGGSVPALCQQYSVPNGLVEAKDTVIVVEASYSFTPMLVGFVIGSTTWRETAYAKPRGMCVSFDANNQCPNSCFN